MKNKLDSTKQDAEHVHRAHTSPACNATDRDETSKAKEPIHISTL